MKNHFVDVLPPNHYLFIYLCRAVYGYVGQCMASYVGLCMAM